MTDRDIHGDPFEPGTVTSTDLYSSLCFRCDCFWGSTEDHKAKCSAYSGVKHRDGVLIHDIVLVDCRDECELYEERQRGTS